MVWGTGGPGSRPEDPTGGALVWTRTGGSTDLLEGNFGAWRAENGVVNGTKEIRERRSWSGLFMVGERQKA